MRIEPNGAWWSSGVFLGIAVVMTVLGTAEVLAFVLERDAPGLGVALVCLGAASVSLVGFASSRRSRER